MNPRNYVLGIVVCGAGVALLWWLRPLLLTSAGAQIGATRQAGARLLAEPSSQAEPLERQIPGGPLNSADPRWKERDAKKRIDPSHEWKMPINFYGCVHDENERPVAGAKVDLSWTDLSQSGSSQLQTMSDEHGCFTLLNKTGRHLEVRVSKDGYYTPQRQQISFDYAAFWEADYHKPIRDKPVIFRLRQRHPNVALAAGEINPSLPPNGAPVRFDLLNAGEITSDGQLELAALMNTERYPPQVFDWRARISIPNGGLIEHDLEFPFDAPESGYRTSAEFNMPKGDPNWKRVIEKNYFIKFDSPPRYGRLEVRLNGASQRATISFWVNPSGSRNSE